MLREAGNVTSKIGDCFKNTPYIYVKVNYHICAHKSHTVMLSLSLTSIL